MLLIDVSTSMTGRPFQEALVGAKDFVDETINALYDMGIMFWNGGIAAAREPTEDGSSAYELITARPFAGGGTNLLPALVQCHDILRPYTGDRVVAILGDGGVGDYSAVVHKVKKMKAENIRFVTRGLGTTASRTFESISDDNPVDAHFESVDYLTKGIAAMATALLTASGGKKVRV